MKYVNAILCFALGVVFLFDLIEIKNTNALYGTIFFMLANLFMNMKKED